MKLMGCFVFCSGDGKIDFLKFFSIFFRVFKRDFAVLYIMNGEWWDVRFNFIDTNCMMHDDWCVLGSSVPPHANIVVNFCLVFEPYLD
jgi:hypothetical protein